MDNNARLIKKIRRFAKNLKFQYDYRDLNVLDEAPGNQQIKEMILAGAPFCAVRGGATEMRCIGEFLDYSRSKENEEFSEKIRGEITRLSGVFPDNPDTLNRFCKLYIDHMAEADLVALWGVGAESRVAHTYCRHTAFTTLHALEPYYFEDPWSQALAGKKVLVVHPFKESIENQYRKRNTLFQNPMVLPKFAQLHVLKAVQSSAGETTQYSSWFDALEEMQNKIKAIDFDVAIIGAGAYGLPLAAYVKSIGRQAVQMSGATQILFGIKGKRWDNHPTISKLYNQSWVRPMESETPSHKEKVEGGCYW